MINRTAQQDKTDDTEAAHVNFGFAAKGLYDEQIQKSWNGKIEAALSNQAQNNTFHHLKQRALGIDTDDQEENEQNKAEKCG